MDPTTTRRTSLSLANDLAERVERAASTATIRSYGTVTVADVLRRAVSLGLPQIEAELGLPVDKEGDPCPAP